MKYYKILNEKEKHFGLQYKTGLNKDPNPFNPSGCCQSGGMYFSSNHILDFFCMGPWIREVTLCKDSNIYKDPDPNSEKWKTDKFVLGERKRIGEKLIFDLIQEGAYVSETNIFDFARKGYIKLVKYSISKIRDYNVVFDSLSDICKFAYNDNHIKIVEFLLGQLGNESINRFDDQLLVNASKFGRFRTMKLLLNAGANIHARNDHVVKDLARYGHIKIIKYLFANFNFSKNCFRSVLKFLSNEELKEVLKIFIEKNIPEEKYFKYMLKNSISEGFYNLVYKLLVDKESIDDDNYLELSAIQGNIKIFNFLNSKIISVKSKKENALIEAASHGNLEIVKVLLKDISIKKSVEEIILMRSVQNNQLETIIFLVEQKNFKLTKNIKEKLLKVARKLFCKNIIDYINSYNKNS